MIRLLFIGVKDLAVIILIRKSFLASFLPELYIPSCVHGNAIGLIHFISMLSLIKTELPNLHAKNHCSSLKFKYLKYLTQMNAYTLPQITSLQQIASSLKLATLSERALSRC